MYSDCTNMQKVTSEPQGDINLSECATSQITFTLENKIYLRCAEALLCSARYKRRALEEL